MNEKKIKEIMESKIRKTKAKKVPNLHQRKIGLFSSYKMLLFKLIIGKLQKIKKRKKR